MVAEKLIIRVNIQVVTARRTRRVWTRTRYAGVQAKQAVTILFLIPNHIICDILWNMFDNAAEPHEP